MSYLWKQVQDDMLYQKTFAKALDFFGLPSNVDQVGNVMFVEKGSR